MLVLSQGTVTKLRCVKSFPVPASVFFNSAVSPEKMGSSGTYELEPFTDLCHLTHTCLYWRGKISLIRTRFYQNLQADLMYLNNKERDAQHPLTLCLTCSAPAVNQRVTNTVNRIQVCGSHNRLLKNLPCFSWSSIGQEQGI